MPYLPHTNPDHDEDLVARLAADDLPADEPEVLVARAWVAECPACAELVTDLLAIASATAALPPPRRTRDFRLTEADAARLRPAGWRGLVGRFGSPTFAFTRPLAAGMATLGIAGLLLATLPSGFGGASSAAPDRVSSSGGNALGVQDSGSEYATAAPAAPPSAALVPGVMAPGASEAPPSAAASADGRDTGSGASPLPASGSGGGVTSEGGSKGSASPAAVAGTAKPAAEVPPGQGYALQDTDGGGPSPLVLLSLVLLVGGLALGALRIVARRIA